MEFNERDFFGVNSERSKTQKPFHMHERALLS